MSAPLVSEREAVERERAAFVAGCVYLDGESQRLRYITRAKTRYELPKVSRPRVVTDPEPGFSQEWRYVDGLLWYRVEGHADREWGWTRLEKLHTRENTWETCTMPTPKRLAFWAELAANPTELVESEP